MIRVKGNDISEAYAQYCSKSWMGFNLRYWDAVTPNTLSQQSGLTFGKRGNGAELTDTEKAIVNIVFGKNVRLRKNLY